MQRLTIALVAATALLAGCSGPAPQEEPVPSAGPTASPLGPVVHHLEGTTTVGMFARDDPAGEFSRLDYNVTWNTTAILVEVRWDDPLQDLDARTWSFGVLQCPVPPNPGPLDLGDNLACTANDTMGYGDYIDRGGGPGQGDSPSRRLVGREEVAYVMDQCADPCAWQAFAWARHPVAGLEWDLWVSVFEGPVPEGYTAIPA